jgi:hypothetical protein
MLGPVFRTGFGAVLGLTAAVEVVLGQAAAAPVVAEPRTT